METKTGEPSIPMYVKIVGITGHKPDVLVTFEPPVPIIETMKSDAGARMAWILYKLGSSAERVTIHDMCYDPREETVLANFRLVVFDKNIMPIVSAQLSNSPVQSFTTQPEDVWSLYQPYADS